LYKDGTKNHQGGPKKGCYFSLNKYFVGHKTKIS
jgi:hypothetical protein